MGPTYGNRGSSPGIALVRAPLIHVPGLCQSNPFVDTTSSFQSRLKTDALQRTSRSRRSSFDSQGPPCTPTTGEQVASNITKIQETIYTLLTYADNISQLDAAKFIERLERQRNAIAYGEEAKKQLIASLSAELEGLKEKLRQCVSFVIAPLSPHVVGRELTTVSLDVQVRSQ